jgi:hypothetical protein
VEAVGTSPFEAESGRVLQYRSDSDAENDEATVASYSPEDIDLSNVGVKKLMFFTENSLSVMAKERERLETEAEGGEQDDNKNGDNALVIAGGSNLIASSSSPLKDDKLSPSDVNNPWTEVDDGTGNVYYHNITTGECTWEKPQGFGEAAQGEDSWVEQKDEGGTSYYLNTRTGETSWTKVSGAAATPTPSIASHSTANKSQQQIEEEEDEEEVSNAPLICCHSQL